MYLVDTNIWLERLLNQERAEDVSRFLEHTPTSRIFVSDFTLHSIGVILIRLRQSSLLRIFLDDLLQPNPIRIVHLPMESLHDVVKASDAFRLDFDDAYQYVLAKRLALRILSFDHDFDRTDIGRITPSET